MKRRKSIRLKRYDYSQNGEYFVTICTKNKEYIFGDVINDKMVLNDCGRMIGKWWHKISTKFSNVQNDVFVIMPNHVHGVIEINRANHIYSTGGHMGPPLQAMIQWFKTMTTNEYIRNVKNNNWQPFDGRLWQRNYYEHIIRNDLAYDNICEYINNNPTNWKNDKLNDK